MELEDLKQALNRLDRRVEEQTVLGLGVRRRQAADRIDQTLRPFRRGQVWLIVAGVATAFAGATAWLGATPGMGGLFLSGVALHAYGVGMIIFGAVLATLAGRVDASAPVLAVQKRLAELRRVYVIAGVVIGLPWFVLWVPAMIVLFRLLFGVDIAAPAPEVWRGIAAGCAGAMGGVVLAYLAARVTGQRRIVGLIEWAFTGPRLDRARTELEEVAAFERA